MILRDTELTSDEEVESFSADCCSPTNVEPDEAGNSATPPTAATVVVDLVVVAGVVVVVQSVCVLDCVSVGGELEVVVSRSL